MLFRDFLEKFRKKLHVRTVGKQLAPSTLYRYGGELKCIEGYFSKHQISKIKPCDVEEFLHMLILDGKSPCTANKYRSLLSQFFEAAKHFGFCRTNPVLALKPFKAPRNTKIDEQYTAEELARYLKAASHESQVYRVAASILAFSGARMGEAMAMSFEDINLEKGYIRVRKIVERHTNTIQYRTKGQKANGQYFVLLKKKLLTILQRWQELTPYNRPTDLILSTETGTHFSHDQMYTFHRHTVQRAGLPYYGFHALRRSFATEASRHGMYDHEVGVLLGHESRQSIDAYIKRKDFDYLFRKAKTVGFGE